MAERRLPDRGGEQGQRPRALSRDEIRERQSAWYPKPYDIGVAAAIKGMAAGTATTEQQQHGMRWIISTLCGTYDQSYRPGEEGRRDTDFAEGARNVGLQLVRLVNIDLSKITVNGEPREQG